MKKILRKLKSQNGFTIQDVVIAMVVLSIFASTIGASYISVFKIQSETKLSAVATSYAIQILENMDKIGYDEVIQGMEEQYKSEFSIPDKWGLNIDVKKYNDDDSMKKITLKITYELSGDSQTLTLEKLKVKEI